MIVISNKTVGDKINYGELTEEIKKYYILLKEGKVTVTNRIFTPTKEGGIHIIGGATNMENENFIVMGQIVMPWFREQGLPVAANSYLYSNFRTGELKGVVGGIDLVRYRTPAKSALAAKYLAQKKDNYTLGLLGLGIQAVTHAEAFASIFNIKRIIATSKNPEKRKSNLESIKSKVAIEVELLSQEEIVKQSDILIVITSDQKPLVNFDDLHKGQLVIGTDHAETVGKDVVLKADKVFVDYRPTAENENGPVKMLLGEGNKYEDLVDGDLLQLSSDEISGRESDDEIIFFQSLGVLNENLAAVEYFYNMLKNSIPEIDL